MKAELAHELGVLLDFFAEEWGNLASVVGVVFSALAVWFSKRASEAAADARKVVLQRTMGDDMNGASRIAGELVMLIAIEKADIALLRTTDLLSQTSYLISRWGADLPVSSRNNLLVVREQLTSIHRVLSAGPITDLGTRQRARLSQAGQRISTIFSEEHGAATRSADGER